MIARRLQGVAIVVASTLLLFCCSCGENIRKWGEVTPLSRSCWISFSEPHPVAQPGSMTSQLQFIEHAITGKHYDATREFFAKLTENIGEANGSS